MKGELRAEFVTDYVWCENCGEAHKADTERKVIFLDSSDTCEAFQDTFEIVETLPNDWEKNYHAEYASYSRSSMSGCRERVERTTAYMLVPRETALLPCHRALFYLTDEPEVQ